MMYYVYVMLSEVDGGFYTGLTGDLKHRVQEHSEGKVVTTRDRRPLELVYYEACKSREDASQREKYLKTSAGKRYLRNRLSKYFDSIT
jgi:putative endonuclease